VDGALSVHRRPSVYSVIAPPSLLAPFSPPSSLSPARLVPQREEPQAGFSGPVISLSPDDIDAMAAAGQEGSAASSKLARALFAGAPTGRRARRAAAAAAAAAQQKVGLPTTVRFHPVAEGERMASERTREQGELTWE